MRLRALDASLIRFIPAADENDGRAGWRRVETLAEADGLWFQCPKCASDRGGADAVERFDAHEGWPDSRGVPGAHYVLCWFVGRVADDVAPVPGRWNPSGTGLDDLTFVGPGAVSVLLTGGCGWHGFVRDGEATLS